MADPLSAIGAAAAILDLSKSAWKAGNYLFRVYQGSKSVNEEIKTLALEVNALASACDLVHEELEEIIKAPSANGKGPQYDQDGRLAKCVERQTNDCEDTLQELWAIVEALWPRGQRFLDNASRQIKLQNSKEQVHGIRDRIKSHTDALHTILLVVNIKVAHVAPGQAGRQLPDTLEDLRVRLQSIEQKLDKQAAQGMHVGDSDATLVGCAHDALRSGISLYEASVTGGSIRGAEDAANSNLMVAEWLAKLNALRIENRKSVISEGESHPPTVFSDDGKLDAATEHSSTLDQIDAEDEADGFDSEDELAEVASTAIKDGSSAFKDEDWTEAHALLQESVDLLELLPHKHRTRIDFFELQFQLATCTYHLKPPADAEIVLQTLLQHPAETDAQSIQLCNARHLLAQCYIRLNKLDMAKDACEATLHARSRLLGRQHDSRYASLALMSHIYGRLGNQTRAKIYASMIPEANRANLLAATHVTESLESCEGESCERADGPPFQSTASVPAVPLASTSKHIDVPAESRSSTRRRMVQLPTSGTKESDPNLAATPMVQHDLTKPSLSRSSPSTEATRVDSAGLSPSQTQLLTNDLPEKGTIPKVRRTKKVVAEEARSIPVTGAKEPETLSEALKPEMAPASSGKPDMPPPPIRSLPLFPGIYKGSIRADEFWPGPVDVKTRRALLQDNAPNLVITGELERLICNGNVPLALSVLNSTEPVSRPQAALQPVTRGSEDNRSLALHLAVLFGDETIIQHLLDRGYKCWWRRGYRIGWDDFTEFTPLELAIACSRVSMIKTFLDTTDCSDMLTPWIGGLIMDPPLPIQIPSVETTEIAAVIKLTLSSKLNTIQISTPENLLEEAMSSSRLGKESRAVIVEFLLKDCHADQLKLLWPRPALHRAIFDGSLELVEILLQNGRQRGILKRIVTSQDAESYDPLYFAVRRAAANKDVPLDIVRRLCDAGASVSAVRRVYESRFLRSTKVTTSTPWSHALDSGRADLIELLRAHKPSLPVPAKQGNTFRSP